MTWLLKGTQLGELQEKFYANKQFSVEYTRAVGRMMNISEEFVHKWFEHINAEHLSMLYATMSKKKQILSE